MAVFCIAANRLRDLSPPATFRHDLALQPKNTLIRVWDYTVACGTLWMLIAVYSVVDP
jgi:hypothetical protein